MSYRQLCKLAPLVRATGRFRPSVLPKRTFLFRRDPISALINEFDREFRSMEREFNRALRGVGGESQGFLPSMFRSTPAIHSGHEVPIRTLEDGSRLYKAHFDMEGFKPEHVKVTLKDNVVSIKAKAEHKDADGCKLTRDYTYAFTLPAEVNADQVKSYIDNSGVLVIEAPLPKMELPKSQVHELQIERGSDSGDQKEKIESK
ncbi:Heat shock protein beta-1 [Halotydeus destructor]|nr:Heat shock protein beta-1 [Halotydeus destructor]